MLRSRPFETSFEIAKTGRMDCYFKVIAKYKDSENFVWYYVELENTILDYDEPEKKRGVKGSKVFFRTDIAQPFIRVKFDRFLIDFHKQNKHFSEIGDNSSDAKNDNIHQRLTRFRRRSMKEDVAATFDKIIGENFQPIYHYNYLDNLPYVGGKTQTESFPDSSTIELDTELQMFSDYTSVEFADGEVADIQHLLVGLDVIDKKKTNFTVLVYNIVPVELDNNVYWSLFCGDAGAVSGDLCDRNGRYSALGIWDEYADKVSSDARNSVINIFNENQSGGDYMLNLFQFFQSTRFSKEDVVGNTYCFCLNKLKQAITNPLHLTIIFNSFNQGLITGKSQKISVKKLKEFIGFSDVNKPLADTLSNGYLKGLVKTSAFNFSVNWYKYKLLNNYPVLDDELSPLTAVDLSKYSNLSIDVFFKEVDKLNS
jgi:hypothetical protein